MIVLTQSYQELGRSEAYAFSDKGQVCACLYARMVDAATVAIKLTRIISGTSAAVGYAYTSAQATLSGSLSHSWNGGASGTVYVGERTVFERNFAVSAGATLDLSAVYDDSYIIERTLNVTCRVAGQKPGVPTVTHVIFDPTLQTRYANVSVYWECENADRYRVNICRLNVPGDPNAGSEVIYEADIYDVGVTFGLAGLSLASGDDLFFTVQAYNASGAGAVGYSDYYRLHPTVRYFVQGEWRYAIPWIKVGNSWVPANRIHVKQNGEWRAIR